MAIDPVALSVLGIDIHWYGIVYMIGFLFAYFFIRHYSSEFGVRKERAEDIFFYTMIFSVIGGRLFYILFYNPLFYLSNPLSVFAVWEGGMSIHGGIFGTFVSLLYFSKKDNIPILNLTDLFSLPAGLGLAFGRLGNFVNQELVGTVTSSPLGVVFPLYDDQRRWPVVLFEGLKNLAIFNVLFFMHIFFKFKRGMITALFLILYSFGRFFIDFLREPTVSLGIISMGQLLCLIYGVAGIWLYIKIDKSPLKKVSSDKEY